MSENSPSDKEFVKRSTDRRQATDPGYDGPERRNGDRRREPRGRT